MVVTKTFPTDFTLKSNPVDADLLIIADSEDNNEMKEITIGSITADIADWIINDSASNTTQTYSSSKINALDTAISAIATTDASNSTKGRTRLSVAPASPTVPIAVGTNDNRVPPVDTSTITADQVAALDGTGTPNGTTGKYVTNDDVAENTASKVVRRKSDSNITVPTTPTASTDAASKAYIDAAQWGSYPIVFTRNANDNSATVTYNHSLGRVPNSLSVIWFSIWGWRSNGSYWTWTQLYYSLDDVVSAVTTGSGIAQAYRSAAAGGNVWVAGNFTSTTFDIVWTKNTGSTSAIFYFVATVW